MWRKEVIGLTFLLVLFAGCSGLDDSHVRKEPQVGQEPQARRQALVEHLEFRIDLDDSQEASRQKGVIFRYTLRNRTENVVICVGSNSRLFVAGESRRNSSSPHPGCRVPMLKVAPGMSVDWVEHRHPLTCYDEMPEGLAKVFPQLMCGAQVPVYAEISVYELREAGFVWGALDLKSEPIVVELRK